MTRTVAAVAAASFLLAIVLANYLTTHYGLVALGFGLSATAGTFAAGATFTLRDAVQDTFGRRVVLVVIAAGVAISALLAPASLALASGLAFACSELADFGVYTPLRARRSWWAAVIASGIVGAVVDTFVFLPIAFGWEAVTWRVVAGQLLAKIAAMAVVALIVAIGGAARTEPATA